MNKTDKGNRRELEARKALEKEGYLTEKKNASRWQSNDFWGLFDILAIKKSTGEVKLIQVKSSMSDFYTAMTKITKWLKKTKINTDVINLEVHVRENYKEWRKEVYKNGEWETVR